MIKYCSLIILSLTLYSCSSTTRFTSYRNSENKVRSDTIKKNSLEENDFDLYKDVVPIKTFTGIASFYAIGFNGRKTSSGEIYDMNKMTSAEPDLPFNSIVRVINLENKKSVLVKINDRGPIKKGRIIDISYAAAKKLGIVLRGIIKVRVEVLRLGE